MIFIVLFHDVRNDHKYILYFIELFWLNCSKVMKRVLNLKINYAFLFYKKQTNKNCSCSKFVTYHWENKWLPERCSLADILKIIINTVNLYLQNKGDFLK